MKIIQITDPHLIGREGKLFGIDPLWRLQACLEDVKANHADAAFCVITGDLAHQGTTEAYEALRAVIETLPMPCHLLLGNHDDRKEFVKIFPDAARDGNGYVQSVAVRDGIRFFFMDTNEPDVHSGCYGGERLGWLREKLEVSQGQPVYLFMHHPPFDIGMPSLDRIKLEQPENLAAVLEGFGNIRHIFLGHVHRPVSGSWRGIPFSTLPSLHHQVPLDFQSAGEVPRNYDPPAYAIVLIEDNQTVVHLHNYLEPSDSGPGLDNA